jgi:hypothetical protein
MCLYLERSKGGGAIKETQYAVVQMWYLDTFVSSEYAPLVPMRNIVQGFTVIIE